MYEKICTKCGENKSIDLFYFVNKQKKPVKYTAACKVCTNKITSTRNRTEDGRQKNKVAVKKWQQRNKEKRKNYELLRGYGITLDEYQKMVESQDGKCGICKKNTANSKRKELYVDHCHKSTKVRGLLCQKCNQGLGLFDDSIVFLTEAIEYLKRNEHE